MRKVKLIRDELTPPSVSISLETVAAPWALAALLVNKLHEEISEVATRMDEPEEYADVLQALMELAELNGVPWSSVEVWRLHKEREKGGFQLGKVMVQR